MTAVEFYNSKVIELMKQREQGTIDVLNFRNELDQVFEQAKEMEKEQMIEFASYYTPLTKEELEIGFKHKFKNQEQ